MPRRVIAGGLWLGLLINSLRGGGQSFRAAHLATNIALHCLACVLLLGPVSNSWQRLLHCVALAAAMYKLSSGAWLHMIHGPSPDAPGGVRKSRTVYLLLLASSLTTQVLTRMLLPMWARVALGTLHALVFSCVYVLCRDRAHTALSWQALPWCQLLTLALPQLCILGPQGLGAETPMPSKPRCASDPVSTSAQGLRGHAMHGDASAESSVHRLASGQEPVLQVGGQGGVDPLCQPADQASPFGSGAAAEEAEVSEAVASDGTAQDAASCMVSCMEGELLLESAQELHTSTAAAAGCQPPCAPSSCDADEVPNKGPRHAACWAKLHDEAQLMQLRAGSACTMEADLQRFRGAGHKQTRTLPGQVKVGRSAQRDEGWAFHTAPVPQPEAPGSIEAQVQRLRACQAISAMVQRVRDTPYKSKLSSASHEVYLKLDTSLSCADLPTDMAVHMQHALSAIGGPGLRMAGLQCRQGCIMLATSLLQLNNPTSNPSAPHHGDSSRSTAVDAPALAHALLPLLQQLLAQRFGGTAPPFLRATLQLDGDVFAVELPSNSTPCQAGAYETLPVEAEVHPCSTDRGDSSTVNKKDSGCVLQPLPPLSPSGLSLTRRLPWLGAAVHLPAEGHDGEDAPAGYGTPCSTGMGVGDCGRGGCGHAAAEVGVVLQVMLQVQVWEMGSNVDLEGWSPPAPSEPHSWPQVTSEAPATRPTATHYDDDMDSVGAPAPPLQVLARAGGSYCMTEVVAMQQGALGRCTMAQVRVHVPAGMLAQHAGLAPSSLLHFTVELWHCEVQLSSTPAMIILAPSAVPHTAAATGSSCQATSTSSSSCAAAALDNSSSSSCVAPAVWWWGAADEVVAAAVDELQDGLQCVGTDGVVPEAALRSYLEFTRDVGLWMEEVRRLACSSGLCRDGAGAAGSTATNHLLVGWLHEPTLDREALLRLCRDLTAHAQKLGMVGLSAMLQQQRQTVVLPAQHAATQRSVVPFATGSSSVSSEPGLSTPDATCGASQSLAQRPVRGNSTSLASGSPGMQPDKGNSGSLASTLQGAQPGRGRRDIMACILRAARDVLLGCPCHLCERGYKAHLQQQLSGLTGLCGLATVLIGVAAGVRALQAREWGYLLVLGPWVVLQAAALARLQLHGLRGRPARVLQLQPAHWWLLGYLWRVVVQYVFIFCTLQQPTVACRLFRAPFSWATLLLVLALSEQMQASAVVPARYMTLLAVCLDLPAAVARAVRTNPGLPVRIAPVVVVLARMLLDAHCRMAYRNKHRRHLPQQVQEVPGAGTSWKHEGQQCHAEEGSKGVTAAAVACNEGGVSAGVRRRDDSGSNSGGGGGGGGGGGEAGLSKQELRNQPEWW